ncbi:MAG TPA: ABC transporter substrate-binding protein [Chloroflexi bacterium]|nr:ABC transporter substrate-binding protein [Chloroflexota bacterium]HPO58061.1 ABC transporter substrate-binding protein [Anaerolineaceae bacterium]
MRNLSRLICLLLVSTLFLSGCQTPGAASTPEEPDQLVFMAGYKPQANLPFVGVYVAQEKGFFAGQNLEVTIEHSAGQGQHLQMVSSGKVHITTQDAGILLRRRSDPGLPLVSIALIGQQGQQAFAALDTSGIHTPQDWEGKRVGYKGTPPPELFALIQAAGADLDKIELVNVGFDPRLLVEDRVDVYPVYKSNEPYILEQWGHPVRLWAPEDYGVPSLGLTYVTSDETLASHTDQLTRFLKAALQGIAYAEEHPDKAVDIVLQYTGPETDRDHMLFMLLEEIEDAHSDLTDEHGLGWQTREQWESLAQMLIEYEGMQQVDVEQVFTNALLEQAAGIK